MHAALIPVNRGQRQHQYKSGKYPHISAHHNLPFMHYLRVMTSPLAYVVGHISVLDLKLTGYLTRNRIAGKMGAFLFASNQRMPVWQILTFMQ